MFIRLTLLCGSVVFVNMRRVVLFSMDIGSGGSVLQYEDGGSLVVMESPETIFCIMEMNSKE